MTPLAQELRRLRRDLNLTLADLAERSGIPAKTLHAYECGRVIPPADRLLALVHATRSAPKPFRLAHVARATHRDVAA